DRHRSGGFVLTGDGNEDAGRARSHLLPKEGGRSRRKVASGGCPGGTRRSPLSRFARVRSALHKRRGKTNGKTKSRPKAALASAESRFSAATPRTLRASSSSHSLPIGGCVRPTHRIHRRGPARWPC